MNVANRFCKPNRFLQMLQSQIVTVDEVEINISKLRMHDADIADCIARK